MPFAYELPPTNVHLSVSKRARGLNFGLSIHLHLYFVYMPAAKSLASLHICADSPEPSLLDNAIRTKISVLTLIEIQAKVTGTCLTMA